MIAYSSLSAITKENFEQNALDLFAYTFENNETYRRFCELLNKRVEVVRNYTEIPFLPIEFFKSRAILNNRNEVEKVFESSGTTDKENLSRHHITDLSLYLESLTLGFETTFGPPEDYCILALLPSYLERENSSLVFMVQELMKMSGHEQNGFFLQNLQELLGVLDSLREINQKVILFGVSFALMDLAEKVSSGYENLIIVETGGMKGKRKEITREELHNYLRKGIGTDKIYSEYGMTELLSQAYAGPNRVFHTPPWMRVLIRDIHDPLSMQQDSKAGGINIIDLANKNSCPFIATQDIGRAKGDGFEVLGRFDNSDIRGCNLMWS